LVSSVLTVVGIQGLAPIDRIQITQYQGLAAVTVALAVALAFAITLRLIVAVTVALAVALAVAFIVVVDIIIIVVNTSLLKLNIFSLFLFRYLHNTLERWVQ
jgi:hypothetical protein